MAEKLHQQQQQQQQQQQKHNQQQQGGQDGRRGSSNSGSGGRADGEGHHDHLSSPQEYSCEICGASGFSDELMRDHTRTCHIEGNAQCPFCGLSGIASAELLLHVNQAHLDYLTPDNELMNFIDDQSPSTYFSIDGDSDSISECRGLSPSITEIPGLINNNNNNNHNINNTIDNIDVNHNNSNINDNYNINNYKCNNNNNNNSPLHSNDNHQQCLNRNINNKQYQMTNVNFYQNGTTKKAHHQSSGPATSISTTSSSSSTSLLPSTNISSNTRPMNQLCSIQSASSSTSSSTISSSSSSAASLPNGDYHTAGTNPEGPNCTEEKAIVERNQNGSQGSPLRSQLGLNLKSHVTISPITIVTTTTTTQTTTTTTTTSSTSTSSTSNTTKLKPIQSPLQCPLCPYTSDKANVLEEHINRLHFDPLSPSLNSSSFIGGGGGVGGASSSSSSSSLLTNGNGNNNNNNNNITTNHSNILNAFGCPLCVRTFESASDLELHVNIEHKDILSPAKIDRNEMVFEQFNGGNHNGNDNSDHDDHDDDDDDRDRCRGRRGDGGGARAQFKNNATTHHKIVNEQQQQQQQQPTKVNKNFNNQSNYCPICNILLDTMNTKEMELHIEGHFSKSPTYLTAKELTAMTNNDGKQIEYEKEAQKLREQREFEMLRAQYGMDDQGNFREQSAAAMQRAVYAGEMSVADYYERQVGLRAAESHGIDDGTSCTKSVVARVLTLSSTSPAIVRTLLCSAVDHYASSYGDKGWGCGYRNLQMILSSLLQNTTFNEALYSAWGKQGPSRTAMPSISRLQKMVEAAWTQGFDVQGSEQLGCKLYNTRKWIGATEVLTVLSWLRINCQLIDFHRPTASDGRHPELFNWVLRYFDEPKIHTPPLYLQHQGHSRTIIGIEQRVSGLTLLVLDPSHGPRQVAALGASQESLRLIRRGSSAMRAPQYQIVAVKGLIDTEEQYQASKVLRSIRIPSDC